MCFYNEVNAYTYTQGQQWSAHIVVHVCSYMLFTGITKITRMQDTLHSILRRVLRKSCLVGMIFHRTSIPFLLLVTQQHYGKLYLLIYGMYGMILSTQYASFYIQNANHKFEFRLQAACKGTCVLHKQTLYEVYTLGPYLPRKVSGQTVVTRWEYYTVLSHLLLIKGQGYQADNTSQICIHPLW